VCSGKLYLGDNKGDLKVFDTDLGEVTKERLKIQDGGIHAMDVTADGKKIYTTGFGNFLKELDAGRMRLRRDFGKIHTDGLIKDIKISGDGRMLTTSDSNGTVKVWSLKRALLVKVIRVRPGVLSIGAI
jgi:WD40 repeat protein